MAAGKSTVAQALAERITASVHVRGDVFRKMIVNGAAEMTPDLSEEAILQLNLRQDISCEVVRRYHQVGFTVIYQDILVGESLKRVVRQLSDLHPRVIALVPSIETLAIRDRNRKKNAYSVDFPPEFLADAFSKDSFEFSMRIDSTNLSTDEVVNTILDGTEKKGTGKSGPTINSQLDLLFTGLGALIGELYVNLSTTA